MNLHLAELINSVPPEFSVKEQNENSILFYHKNKKIYIDWYNSGQPWELAYFEKDDLHRPYSEGPAQKIWHNNGFLKFEDYWENGISHRPSTEGPSYRQWNEEGVLKDEQYWEYGVKLNISPDQT